VSDFSSTAHRLKPESPSHAEPEFCSARLYLFILATLISKGSNASFASGSYSRYFFESISKRPQRFLLAANKSKRWVFFRRRVRRKEDTVAGHPELVRWNPFKRTATVFVSDPPQTFVAVRVYLNSSSRGRCRSVLD